MSFDPMKGRKLISIRAMESGEYSDLSILCEDQKFSVHKIVVCSQSKVLAAAMKKGFKVMQEICSGGMTLPQTSRLY